MPASELALEGAQSTLLIPLYARALESARHSGVLEDERAEHIAAALEVDFESFGLARASALMLALRARTLDDWARAFLSKHPEATVLQLGCGLDSRAARLGTGYHRWIDVDLPRVIELRRRFFDEGGGYEMLGASVTEESWLETLRLGEAPVLVIAEGLLMYLEKSDAKSLIARLATQLAGGELLCDVYSSVAAQRANATPLANELGVELSWGLDDPKELETWHDGVELLETWDFTRVAAMRGIETALRLRMRVAGLFRTAREAHRLLRYRI